MGSLSLYSEEALINHAFNGVAYTPAATLYLALSTADPLDDASGLAEPAAGGYARAAIAFSAAASRAVVQSGVVTFPQATAAWGTITHYAIMDAATGGNMLAHGSFVSAFSPVAGNTPSVADGQVQISVNASIGAGFTDYLVHALLDLMFNATAYTPPATYVALTTATVADADTVITEMTGTGYARVLIDANGGTTPTWTLASGSGVISNAAAVEIGPPTADDWGQITSMAILDAATGGNILAYDNDNVVDQTPTSADTISFAAGDIGISLT